MLFAISGDYNTWSVITVILESPGSLLSHVGEFDQHFRLLGCRLLRNQESAVDSCEANMLGELVSVSLLRVW